MYCPHCGTQLPDDALFCLKCGTNLSPTPTKQATPMVAPAEAKALKCPSCGGPLAPKFGEMIVSCEYCGSSITLGDQGWRSVQKQSMLPIKLSDKEQVLAEIRGLLDQGLLHRHLYEESKLEELNLSMIPYWIVSVSARTTIVASDIAAEAGQIATTAALAGLMGVALGGGRGRVGFGAPLVTGAVLGTALGTGRGGRTTAQEVVGNYNFPIVAVKAFNEFQPKDYHFHLEERGFFDMARIPKTVKVMNGDLGEESAKNQARTLVEQLQTEKAHQQFHMIQKMNTEVDVSDTELLYVPIWFSRYDHDGKRIVLIIDANSSGVINSLGL